MTRFDDISLITLNSFTGPLGSLISIEEGSNIDFDPKRIFYVFNVPTGSVRGGHGHEAASQLLIAISGKCRINCRYKESSKSFVLSSPSEALFIPPGIWAEQVYEEDGTVLMVVSDEKYSQEDYRLEP